MYSAAHPVDLVSFVITPRKLFDHCPYTWVYHLVSTQRSGLNQKGFSDPWLIDCAMVQTGSGKNGLISKAAALIPFTMFFLYVPS